MIVVVASEDGNVSEDAHEDDEEKGVEEGGA